MKMVGRILSQIEGIETFGIATMLIFFAMFLAVGIWLLTLRKGHFDKARMMPLEDDENVMDTINENSNQ